jgi:Xaa-Pro aminopeptidase
MDRIKKLQKQLLQWKVEGCLVENTTDLFYLTGIELTAGSLFVLPRSVRLFVDGRYFEMVQKKGTVPCGNVQEVERFLKEEKKIAFDSSCTSYGRFLKLKKWGCSWKAIPGLLKELRVQKDPSEIAFLKKSGRLALKGIEHVASLLKEGITEKELAKEFEIFCLKQGAERLAFDPIIAFGKNTAYPHYRAGNTRLKQGDLVLVDAGVVIDHYCSDLTRVFFFGKEDPEIKKMFNVVKKAQQAALELCRPGTTLGELDEAAGEVIAKAGMQSRVAHGLGHGVGLEIHEFPRVSIKGEDRSVKLLPNMVITIEPGLYLLDKGGVRYEDTIIITENGYEFAL